MYVQLAMSSNDSTSIYLKAFDELYPLLVESLTSDYADLTNRLFSKSLVSDVIRKTITSRTTGKTETERTGILIDAVRNRISQTSDNFDQFLKVLRDSEVQVYKDAAKLLQQRIFSLSKQINSELQDPKYKKRSTKKYWILLTGESIYSNGILTNHKIPIPYSYIEGKFRWGFVIFFTESHKQKFNATMMMCSMKIRPRKYASKA